MSHDYRNVQYGIAQQNAAILGNDLRQEIAALKNEREGWMARIEQLARRIAELEAMIPPETR